MHSSLQTLLVLAIGGLAAGGTWWIKGPPKRAFNCNPALLKPDEICLKDVPSDREIVWIDARLRKDWQKNGLPGSLLWNEDGDEDMLALEEAVVTKIMQTPYVVVYCYDKQCQTSHNIAARVKKLGLGAEVRVLSGGWDALNEAGRIPIPSQKP